MKHNLEIFRFFCCHCLSSKISVKSIFCLESFVWQNIFYVSLHCIVCKLANHSAQRGKSRNLFSKKKKSSNQLFSNSFSKTVTFTNFWPKKYMRLLTDFGADLVARFGTKVRYCQTPNLIRSLHYQIDYSAI